MNGLSYSVLGALASSAVPQDGIQGTTSIKRITKAIDPGHGFRPSCKQVRRQMKAWASEGILEFHPVDTGQFSFSSNNQPLVVTMTPKGLAYMIDPYRGGLPPDPLTRIPGDLPRWDPAAQDLPQKARTVLRCIMELCDFFRMKYCWPSLETIRWRCENYYHTKMSVRQVERELVLLQGYGFIRRQVRPQQNKDGTWWSMTALTEVADRLWNWAKRELKSTLSFLSLTDMPSMAIQEALNKKEDTRNKDKGAASPAVFPKPRGHGGLLSLRSILAPSGR